MNALCVKGNKSPFLKGKMLEIQTGSIKHNFFENLMTNFWILTLK